MDEIWLRVGVVAGVLGFVIACGALWRGYLAWRSNRQDRRYGFGRYERAVTYRWDGARKP